MMAIGAGVGVVGIALAHGLAIAVMVSATAAVSGGHLNPAVSFGLWIGRRITLKRLLGYWVAQLAGGFSGALIAYSCMPTETLINLGAKDASYGLPSVSSSMMPM